MANVRPDHIVRNNHRIRLLHLSDLHERVALHSMKEEREAKIARTKAQRYRVLSDNFFETLRSIQKQRAVDMVCFTGDVADCGLKEEYERAAERFDLVLDALDLPVSRLFVVPGNHDVNRTIEERAWKGIRDLGDVQAISNWMGGEEPPKGAEAAWREKILYRTQAFRDWLKQMGRGELVPDASSRCPLGYRKTLTFGGLTVHVIGLDSAWLCGDDHDARAILLTQRQIDALTTDEDGKPLVGFRLALLHHPLDDLRDASNSRRLLGEGVDLLLYGHRHETNLAGC